MAKGWKKKAAEAAEAKDDGEKTGGKKGSVLQDHARSPKKKD